MLYVIAYDISSDRDRTRVSNRLEDLGGRRINRSVYELLSEPRHVEQLIVDLADLLDPATDSVVCYPVCNACYRGGWWWPEAPGPWPGGVIEV